jgi:hypothetical protein
MNSAATCGALWWSARWLVIAAFALRVLVPVGYMPTAISGGWFLQLCPDGLSAQGMMRLLGGGHGHHHHHADDAGSAEPLKCDLGASLSAELGKVDAMALPNGETAELPRVAGEAFPSDFLILLAFRSRAPPILPTDLS